MEPLVGRAAEQAAVARVIGSSGAVVVRGEPGVGKTALLEAALATVPAVRVLRATGAEGEAEVPYAGLAELVRPLADRIRTEAHLRPLAVATGVAEASGDLFPLQVEAALERLLRDEAPVVVAVDDAHWLDDASARVLARLARGSAALETAMVFTARPGGFTPAGVPDLWLDPLDAASARLLFGRAAGDLTREVAEQLLQLAAGNPLALLELPRSLRPAQRLGLERVEAGHDLTESLLRTFGGRLRRLSAAGRTAAIVAAVADSADAAALPAALTLAGLSEGALGEAEDQHLIRVGADIRFRHPLVRAAVLAEASAAGIRLAHAALGEASADDRRRTWHRALAALQPDPALAGQLELHADAARARIAFAAEARLMVQAARLSDDAGARARRLVRAAGAEWRAGAPEHAERLLGEAAEADAAAAETTAALMVRYRLASAAGAQDALPAITERLARAAGSAPAADAVLALRLAAIQRLMVADPDAAVAHASTAMRRAAGEPALEFLGHEALAMSLVQAGRVAEARGHCQAAVSLTDAGHGHPDHITTLGNPLSWCELYADGRRLLAAEADRHRRAGNPRMLAGSLENLSHLLRRTGQLRAAEEAAAEAVGVTRRLDERSIIPITLAALAHARALLGEPDALALAQEAAAMDAEAETPVWAAAALACAHLLSGDPEGALAALVPAEALEPGYREPNELRIAGLRLEALITAGRLDAARRALDPMLAAARGSSTRWTRATAARYQGVLAEDDDQAEDAFTSALAQLPGREEPIERAMTQLDHGRRLARAGRRTQAREALEEAYRGFTACGARPLADTAARQIGATAPRLRPRQPGTGEELTPREREIAERAASGSSDREIAAALFLSARTVDFHLRNVFRKLGVRSRTELANRLHS
jgi:DNA-binding CsgD family transcriptional regulator